MQPVKMYSTATCPYCIRAKALLKQRGVETIDEIRVDEQPAQREAMIKLTRRWTVPQIFIGETHVGGAKVSAADAVRLINREKAVLIDISEPAEYAAGHAVGARSVPLAALETSRDLPKNKSLPLVVVCPTGTRAPRAVATLKKLGFENTTALAGGLAAWRAANLPTERTA